MRRTLEEITGMVWFSKICDITTEMLQSCDICVRKTKPLLVKHDVGLFSPTLLREATPWSIVCADIVYLPPGVPYLSQQCVVSKFACLCKISGEDVKVMKAYNSTVHSVTHRIAVEVLELDPIGKASDRVEWERLVNNAVKLAEEKLQR
ncbi:hypothetical protein FOZ63_014137, partial [Perkinsus olseni]